MTLEGRGPADRQLAGWIEEGPTRAPAGLLAQTVARTRQTAQRPTWLAAIASDATVRTPRREGLSLRQALLLAVLLLTAAVATAFLAGSLSHRDLRLVVAPSNSPDALATTGPLPTAGETFQPASLSTYELLARPDLGFEVAYAGSAGTAGPWDGFGISSRDSGTTFGTGGCVDTVCKGYVAITSALVADGAPIRKPDGTVVRLMGSRPEELEADWISKMGSTAAPQTVLVGGFVASRFDGAGVIATVGAHGNRLFVLEAMPSASGSPADAASLDLFAAHFRYLDEPVPMTGTLRTFRLQIAAPVATTSTVTADSPNGFIIGSGEKATGRSEQVWSSWIRVLPAPGATLVDAMQKEINAGPRTEAWIGEETFGGHRAYTILRPGSDPMIPTAHDPVVMIELEAGVFIVDAHVDNGDAEPLLRSFLASMKTGSDLPSVSYTFGDLVLAAPGVWTVSSVASSMQITTDRAAGLFGPVATLEIDLLSPGSALTIARPTVEVPNGTGAIRGTTLNELKASVMKAFTLQDVPPTRLAGQRAFSWTLAPTGYIQTLRRIAITEWKGQFYVFTERLFLDASPGEDYATLLLGIQFT